jgi:hypothetical protein
MSSSNAPMNPTAPVSEPPGYDLMLVGGGLQNMSIARNVPSIDPARRIALLAREAAPGGNYTWCLHSRHIRTEARSWVTTRLVCECAGYNMRITALSRTVSGAYRTVTSQRVSERVVQAMEHASGSKRRLGPDSSIHRFPALQLTIAARTRLATGRPPQGFKQRTALKSRGAPLSPSLLSVLGSVRGAYRPTPEQLASEGEDDPTLERQPGSAP